MSNHRNTPGYWACLIAVVFIIPVLWSCGIIADKDRIKVAKIGEEYFTRGDLSKAIRDMPSEERPNIRTKGDLRVALSNIIDERIKQGQAASLKDQGKINVTRQEAQIQYIVRYPEKYQNVVQMEAVLAEDQFKVYEEELELGIDREEDRLYGDRALIYLINDAVENQTLLVTDEQYEEQYELRKGQMYTFEQVAIQGVYLPLDAHEDLYEVDAYAEASIVRNKLQNGADPKTVAESYGGDPVGYLEVGLINQGADPKFTMFWQRASGSKEGDIFVSFIPGWQRNITVAGEKQTVPIPDSQLVCRVAQYIPARQKTLEEAKPVLRSSILFAEIMERLRDQAGVEIYDDKLPDPGMYDSATPASIMEQQ